MHSTGVKCEAILLVAKLYTHLAALDVGMFDSVKNTWGKVLKQWKLEIRGTNVSKEAFPALIVQLWAQSLTPAQCISGLRASGIPPLSHDAMESKPGPKDMQSHCSTGTRQTSVPNSLFIRTHLHG